MAENIPSFNSVDEIVCYCSHPHAHMVWIGKDYSLKNLMDDLAQIKKNHSSEIVSYKIQIEDLQDDLHETIMGNSSYGDQTLVGWFKEKLGF